MDCEDLLFFILIDEIDEELFIAEMSSKRESEHEMFKRRAEEGYYRVLIKKYLFEDEDKFREFFRVSRKLFYHILSYIKDDISKTPYNRVKDPICVEEKLCLTLRYMATGESFRSLAFGFRISNSWISHIVKNVLEAISERLLQVAIPQPTEAILRDSEAKYRKKWNFPNCVASIDGKHIRVTCPSKTGSLHFNYKGYFSIVLLALVDPDYRFLAIDVGGYGKEGDAGLFAASNMGKWINSGLFPFPPPKKIAQQGIPLPHVIVGDEAFKLTSHMMRPYPKEQSNTDTEKAIYNYRHSRARRTSENGFGILCQYFRVFFTPISISPDTADNLISAACIIHNFLRQEKIPYPGEENTAPSDAIILPTENMLSLERMGGNATFEAFRIRDTFKTYFCSAQGRLTWQLNHVSKTN